LFLSDNGMNMGHHGICGKGNGTYPQNMYDTSVKVPCIVSRPGHVPAGRLCGDLYSQYDILPTLLDYAGVANPEAARLPGAGFAALLRGEEAPAREHVVVFDEYGPVRMIRNRTCKYVHRYPDGPHEFYDLAGDPDEERNRIDDPSLRQTIAAMRAELEQWFERYADPGLDGKGLPVTGWGQNDRPGCPQKGNVPFAQGVQEWWRPGREPTR
jgi:arylsulfatase A-like enzyme